MNLQIDELFQQAQIKSQIDAMRDQSDNITWEYECDHEVLLERLEELIIRKDAAIVQVQNRMDQQVALKQREINNAADKLATAKQELKSIKKKTKLSEADKVMALQEKISYTQEQNKELQREFKMLKRQ